MQILKSKTIKKEPKKTKPFDSKAGSNARIKLSSDDPAESQEDANTGGSSPTFDEIHYSECQGPAEVSTDQAKPSIEIPTFVFETAPSFCSSRDFISES